jgi:hypothetical protein
MLTFSYIIKHIIINKNKKLHNFYTLFTPYNKKVENINIIWTVSEYYIYHLRIY